MRRTMAASNAARQDPILLSAWHHDYRVSLAVVAAGIIVLAALLGFGLWATSTGNYPTSFGAGLAIYLTGTAGFMLIVLGWSWAYTNRRFLELSQRNA